MSRFVVQEDVGRVTIVSDQKRSTFSIKNVKKRDALLMKEYFQNLSKAQKKFTSSVTKPVKKENATVNLRKAQQQSPSENRKALPPTGRMCYSDCKQKTKRQISLGKRNRSASSPVRLCVSSDDEKLENNIRQTSNGQSKKYQDFRKAQSDVRRTKTVSEANFDDDAKENTSPNTSKRLHTGLNKASFYGSSRTEGSFLSEMKNSKISRSPSPIRRSPSKLDPTVSITYRTAGSVVRSLLTQDNVSLQNRKDDLGILNLHGSTFEEKTFDDMCVKQSPLTDKVNVISSSSSSPRRGGGFQNLGNTCYMNSTLQSLFGLASFQKDLQKIGDHIDLPLNSDSVLKALINLMQNKTASPARKSNLLKGVKLAISSNAKQFHGFAQQDAHEFVRLCLDLVQEDVVNVNKKLSSSARLLDEDLIIPTKGLPDESKEKIRCPVTDNFSFTLKNEIVCSSCNAVNIKEEQLYDLPVELRQRRSSRDEICLQKLVNLSFSVEKVEHECDKCKHKQASVHKLITKLPRVMLIYLKRYSYNSRFDQSEKLRQRVSIPRYLTFHKHCDEEVQYSCTEKFDFSRPPEKPAPTQCDVDAITDQELEQYFESLDSFDQISSIKVSSPYPSGPEVSTDGNNNKQSEPEEREIATGSSGSYHTSRSIAAEKLVEDDMFEKAVQASVRDYMKGTQPGLPDQTTLQAMSEEDQILLAMQLSMQESFQTDQTETSIDKTSVTSSFEKISPCSIDSDAFRNVSPQKKRNRRTRLSSNPFESPESEKMNSSTEALNGNNGNNSSSSVHSRSSQVTAPCQTPEKVEHPDLAHTCPSLSSIQLLNEVGKGEKSNGSSLVDMVSNAKTDERGDHSFSSFIDVGSSGLDLFTQRHSDSSEEPRSTKSIKRETSPASDMDEDIENKNFEEDSNEVFKNLSTGHLPHSYHIVSIVSHKGGSSKHGHYVSDVLTNYSSNQWQCFDDDYVERFSEECVLLGRQSSCYLLFYVHK